MLTNDDAFDAMGAMRRRKLLISLLEHEPQRVAGLSEGSQEMTEANETFIRGFLSGSLEIDGVEKTLVRLHHVDLPKLADHGFVEWSSGNQVVSRGPRFDELTPLLELLVDLRREDARTEVVSSAQ